MKKREIKLYLLRHGETAWNVQKKFQGQLNSPLTENGIEKLKDTARELMDIDFQGVYTSQMRRTIESAKIILEKNIKYLKEPVRINNMKELNEIYFGIWQGMTYEEIEGEYPEEYDNYFNNPSKYEAWIIGGEDLDKGLERFLNGIERIASFEEMQYGSGKILVVTHGTVLELFMNHINHRKMDDLEERKLIGNGEYKIFSYNESRFL